MQLVELMIVELLMNTKQYFDSDLTSVYLWTYLQLNKLFSKKYANITIESDEKACILFVHSKPQFSMDIEIAN